MGNETLEFKMESPIVEYYSPIGNNCLSCLYAILENGDICLFVENVILKNKPNLKGQIKNNFDNPYFYCYRNIYICVTIHFQI